MAYQQFIQTRFYTYPTDIYCLQEAKFSCYDIFPISGYCCHFAENIKMKKFSYGVLTASRYTIKSSRCLLSQQKEPIINTHKTTLLCFLRTKKGPLLIINIHAINFKTFHQYDMEISLIEKELLRYPDHKIIFAGDFNTWSRQRYKRIVDLCRLLNLKVIKFQHDKYIKQFNKQYLDLVLYRGVVIEKSIAINSFVISDHNPLWLKCSLD